MFQKLFSLLFGQTSSAEKDDKKKNSHVDLANSPNPATNDGKESKKRDECISSSPISFIIPLFHLATECDADSEEEPKTYDITYYELTDGKKIARVETTNGVHFIVINETLTPGQINYSEHADNIKEFRLKELQDEHYTKTVEEWTKETKVNMRDKYIDQIAVALGLISAK